MSQNLPNVLILLSVRVCGKKEAKNGVSAHSHTGFFYSLQVLDSVECASVRSYPPHTRTRPVCGAFPPLRRGESRTLPHTEGKTMTEHERIQEAYLQLATVANYRPAAAGDGLGHVHLTRKQLQDPARLREEAALYADRFIAEEDDFCKFFIGISNWQTNRVLVYTIEAARLLCFGMADKLALKLLSMAIEELTFPKGKLR